VTKLKLENEELRKCLENEKKQNDFAEVLRKLQGQANEEYTKKQQQLALEKKRIQQEEKSFCIKYMDDFLSSFSKNDIKLRFQAKWKDNPQSTFISLPFAPKQKIKDQCIDYFLSTISMNPLANEKFNLSYELKSPDYWGENYDVRLSLPEKK
jgi:hypothetical protein